MDAEIRQFRHAARIHNRGRTGTAIRYTPELRRQAVALARGRVAQGLPLVATAKVLGLRIGTLSLWLRKQPRSTFRPIKLAGPIPSPVPPDASY